MAETDPATHLCHLKADGYALAETVRAGELEARVPSCPDWTVADLVEHLGKIHRWVSAMVRDDRRGRTSYHEVLGPRSGDLLSWYEEGHDSLLTDLKAIGPDQVLMTWAGEQTTRFWYRRMAQETAVHRWDVQAAFGSARAIGSALAVDGIDELLDVFVPRRLNARLLDGKGETIVLRSSDAADEWALRLGASMISVSRGHAEGDVVVRGCASYILLLLWGRLVPNQVSVVGDSSLLDRWNDRMRI